MLLNSHIDCTPARADLRCANKVDTWQTLIQLSEYSVLKLDALRKRTKDWSPCTPLSPEASYYCNCSVTCINCNMRVGKSFVTYFIEESLFGSCWREVNADWRLSRRGKSSVFLGHCLTSANRRFPEITGENNLTVFSYSWRVKSPE